jgi:hypothetical protein
MFVLTSPLLAGNHLALIIVRDENHYYLAYSRGYYGHCPTRITADFNPTTAGGKPNSLPNGYPYIWLEPTSLPKGENILDEVEGLISKLLVAQPRAPIRPTGRKRAVPGVDGGAVEIVIMLSEDELAHCCYYCGRPEEVYDPRYRRIGGKGHSRTYGCPEVSIVSCCHETGG